MATEQKVEELAKKVDQVAEKVTVVDTKTEQNSAKSEVLETKVENVEEKVAENTVEKEELKSTVEQVATQVQENTADKKEMKSTIDKVVDAVDKLDEKIDTLDHKVSSGSEKTDGVPVILDRRPSPLADAAHDAATSAVDPELRSMFETNEGLERAISGYQGRGHPGDDEKIVQLKEQQVQLLKKIAARAEFLSRVAELQKKG